MKRLILAMILLPAALWAQAGASSGAMEDTSVANAPSYSQIYCSGFITKEAISRSNFILGSSESPHQDRFGQRSVLFLRGSGFAADARYSIIRQVVDPNREDSSPEQRQKLASLGAHYEDIGWVTVRSIENGTAVATLDFACDAALPGDILVPFQERPQITLRKDQPELESFRAGTAAVRGHILGARDYLSVVGSGLIVYTDFGSNKGAKPGDYLVVSRGYAPENLNRMDRISEHLPRGMELSAVDPARIPLHSDALMPNHILGEMVVLNVSPDVSVALITRSAAEIELGDVVQQEGAEPEQSSSAPEASEASASRGSRLHRAFSVVRDKAEAIR